MTNSSDSWSGSAPKPGWVQHLIRFSIPFGVQRVAADVVAEGHRVPLLGARVGPGTLDVDLGGPLVELELQDRRVREDQRVGRHGAVVLLATERARGVVDALALVVLHERRHLELFGKRDDVVLGGTDERAAGLDHRAPGQPVVQHPAADAVARLDDQHRATAAGDLACGHQAGDAGPHDDDIDPAGQRALQGRGLRRAVENACGQYADARRRRAAQERAPGDLCHVWLPRPTPVGNPVGPSLPTQRASATSATGGLPHRGRDVSTEWPRASCEGRRFQRRGTSSAVSRGRRTSRFLGPPSRALGLHRKQVAVVLHPLEDLLEAQVLQRQRVFRTRLHLVPGARSRDHRQLPSAQRVRRDRRLRAGVL